MPVDRTPTVILVPVPTDVLPSGVGFAGCLTCGNGSFSRRPSPSPDEQIYACTGCDRHFTARDPIGSFIPGRDT